MYFEHISYKRVYIYIYIVLNSIDRILPIKFKINMVPFHFNAALYFSVHREHTPYEAIYVRIRRRILLFLLYDLNGTYDNNDACQQIDN